MVFVQVKFTVTGTAVYQPFAFGCGAALAEMVGGIVAILSVTLAVAVFPAASVTVPEMIWFAPSELTV